MIFIMIAIEGDFYHHQRENVGPGKATNNQAKIISINTPVSLSILELAMLLLSCLITRVPPLKSFYYSVYSEEC